MNKKITHSIKSNPIYIPYLILFTSINIIFTSNAYLFTHKQYINVKGQAVINTVENIHKYAATCENQQNSMCNKARQRSALAFAQYDQVPRIQYLHEHEIYPAHKCQNANFNNYEQDKCLTLVI